MVKNIVGVGMNTEEVILRDDDLSLFGRKLTQWLDEANVSIQRMSQDTQIPRARIYRLMDKMGSSALTYAEIISISQLIKRPSNEVLAVYYSSQQGLAEVSPDLLTASDAEMYIMTYLALTPEKRQIAIALMETLLDRAKNEEPQVIHAMLMSLPTMQGLAQKEPQIKGKPHTRSTRKGQKKAEQRKEPPLS